MRLFDLLIFGLGVLCACSAYGFRYFIRKYNGSPDQVLRQKALAYQNLGLVKQFTTGAVIMFLMALTGFLAR
ncbi:MAG TPA: hypothetical protein VH327_00515 [Gammaproteobacteria bacterium]|nr:hypothetical protein [Gammaproteobacteria bacterium]